MDEVPTQTQTLIMGQLRQGLPVIAHIRTPKISTHFVVITGVRNNDFIINDPESMTGKGTWSNGPFIFGSGYRLDRVVLSKPNP